MLNSFLYMQRSLVLDSGHSSDLDQKNWYSIREDSPQGESDKIAELMMPKLGESRHPVFRATSPLSRGQLKSKGGGKLSIHYCADLDTIETVFRTIIPVNLLSLHGVVAEMCEKYESYHERTGRPVVGGQSSSSFVPSLIKTNVPLNNDDPAHKEFPLQKYGERIEKLSQQADWVNSVWMQDSWLQLKSDSTSWRRILQNFHNSQMQWLVVSTRCQEMKKHLNQKVGSEGTPKLGPYWKLQPVACEVNMELRSELSL